MHIKPYGAGIEYSVQRLLTDRTLRISNSGRGARFSLLQNRLDQFRGPLRILLNEYYGFYSEIKRPEY